MTDCTVQSCWHRRGGEPTACPFEAANALDRSLIVSHLDLGRELADRRKVSFRTHGTCMYPCIRPGDLLTVESRTIEQINVGEIVVFRRGDTLFSHRAISAGTSHQGIYIVTRSDRAGETNDGPLYAEDILGVVISVRRGNANQPLDPQPLRGLVSLYAAGSEFRDRRLRPLGLRILKWMQKLSWYRSVSRIWIERYCRDPKFVVRVPLGPRQSHDLYRRFPADEFDPGQLLWRGEPPARWALDLYLNGERTASGMITIVRHPDNCPRGSGWWAEERKTRLLYRGTGLEDALFDEAGRILAKDGMMLQGRTES